MYSLVPDMFPCFIHHHGGLPLTRFLQCGNLGKFMDLSVKGQHGDQDIMESCIVCMIRLIWLQQLGYSGLDGQNI
jgi:hypothetical protein